MPQWVQLLLATLGGGGLLTALIAVLRLRAERRKLKAEALAIESATAEGVFRQLMELRVEFRAAEMVREKCEKELADVKQRMARLESALPAAMLSAQLDRLSAGLLAVLDAATDPCAIVAPTNGGQFVFANAAFCAAMKMTLVDVLKVGWRALIVEDDLARTREIETGMWTAAVTIVNRYRASDGTLVTFRWTAMRYEGGMSLALARVQG